MVIWTSKSIHYFRLYRQIKKGAIIPKQEEEEKKEYDSNINFFV